MKMQSLVDFGYVEQLISENPHGKITENFHTKSE